jgi:cytochrome oxidase assembly protein ShyY1
VYRFLLTPRWIGLGLLMTALAAVMVGLGLWQLDRYHYRSEINARIDAAASAQPVPLPQVLAQPASARGGSAAPAPPQALAWTRVSVTGRYDPSHEILARARTVNGSVGFEVITPLVLPDGSAVLVDRGWVPPGEAGASALPSVPPAPTGEVTVVGRVHLPESRAGTPEPFSGVLTVRRVAPDKLAASLPYPLYGAYVTVENPGAGLVGIPPDHENAAMNAGYVVQWWLFAALTLSGFVYLAVRQAHPVQGSVHDLDESVLT